MRRIFFNKWGSLRTAWFMGGILLATAALVSAVLLVVTLAMARGCESQADVYGAQIRWGGFWVGCVADTNTGVVPLNQFRWNEDAEILR